MSILKNSITAGNAAIAPEAIKAQRAPIPATDKNYDLGQVWIDIPNNDVYTLTSFTGGIPNWEATAGGAGAFAALTVNPGPSTLVGTTTITGDNNVAGVITLSEDGGALGSITIESLQGTSDESVLIQSAVGGIKMNTASAAGDIEISSDMGGIVNIVSTGNTGTNDLLLNVNGGTLSELLINNELGTSVEAIKILSPVGGIQLVAEAALNSIVLDAELGSIVIAPTDTTVSVDIANITPAVARITTINGGDVDTAIADTLNLGTGGVNTDVNASKVVNIATGNNLLGDTLVNISTGTATTGTKRIDMGNVDALTTITAYGTVDINTFTSTGTTTIGNVANSGGIALLGGPTGDIQVIRVAAAAAAGPAATVTVVNNSRVGIVTFAGYTQAAGTTLVLTLTNSFIAAGSAILASVTNTGANDAQMLVTRILPGVGTANITIKNDGAAALNGDMQLSFWVLS